MNAEGRSSNAPAFWFMGRCGRSASCLTAAVRRNARLEDALDLLDVGVLADRAHHVHQMTAVADLNGDADELLSVLVVDHHADDAGVGFSDARRNLCDRSVRIFDADFERYGEVGVALIGRPLDVHPA